MTTYIALLQGINVGGHKPVAMADLRDFLTQLRFVEPRTLLQSGNVVFGSNARTAAQLERLLEAEAVRTGSGARASRTASSKGCLAHAARVAIGTRS